MSTNGRGVCHQLLLCEPLCGWRQVQVTERRTRYDYARCMRDWVDVHYPRARKIRLVQDNLNTHDGMSLYEALPRPRRHAAFSIASNSTIRRSTVVG